MVEIAVAMFLLIITPGPGVLSLAGVGAAFGFRKAVPYFNGLFAGNLFVYLIVATGLAALILAEPFLRTLLLGVSLFYLLYLAARIAFAGSKIALIHAEVCPGFFAGFLLQPINPKAYAVNTFFVTGFPIYPESYWIEIAMKFAVMMAVWIPVHLAWAFTGSRLHRLDLSPRAQRAINVGMAATMLIVVAIAMVSSAD